MAGVLVGFAIIASVILVGYVVGRAGILGEHSRFVLSRLAFYVLSPFLLFTVLADADVHILFSSVLPVSFAAALVAGLVFAGIARLAWRRPIGETVIGSLASGYVNANNIGIPVALYALGDAAFAAPVMLLQLLVFAPVALAILDARERGTVSARRVLIQPFTNSIIVASLLGVLLAVFDITLPAPIMEPFRVIGAAAVPVVLLAFGISLHGQRPLAAGSGRREIVLASSLKLVLMPVVAWLVGALLFRLEGTPLFAVVLFAALPSAQNVFNYAQRYEQGEIIARDVVLITTVLCVPVVIVVAALFA